MNLFIEGFALIFNFNTILIILAGVALGLVFGSIPGLTATMAVAICLPISFGMDAANGMALLMGLYIGGVSGGMIPAILLNLPGTPSSISTTFDGYPMAQKGLAGRAFGLSIISSFFGGLISIIILMLLSPPLAQVALEFGPFEYFAITMFALTLISSLSEGSLVKGLIAALIGLTLSFVGAAPIDSYPRWTFGVDSLRAGFQLLPVLIGLFAISEMLKVIEDRKPDIAKTKDGNSEETKVGFPLGAVFRKPVNFIRSTLMGVGIGILPGIGGGTANIIAYVTAKRQSKTPEKFGEGIDDGVIASESANNSAVGGALVPLISLGIPGDTVTAMLLGGLMIHGLQAGPLLFENNGPLVYSIFVSLLIANVFMAVLLLSGMKGFVKLLSIPKHYLYPVIIALCVVGSFGVNNRIFDAGALIFFGILGYLMIKGKFPLTPLILGFILGPIAEVNLRRGLQMSSGDFMPFLTQPIAAVFWIIAIGSIAFSLYKEFKKTRSS
ncbi:tripartite tricarboxylate transporter permease [Salinicoccus sp. ID82-1]|uniref:Tat pathway signal protein n=1 Tax=Salinicoccus cyprini TaxID=2493691 RepID=A0A558ASZ6_9STAP|nr:MULTISPECIES: tripartite tricarboxylate transporter permease [Salinicoccus]MCG1009742.1 tripartite tricarboxylate transporter permease [Salinicoccus sp. ID82-1]TVT27387.1 Tat pathway signal protein [Salinicoccus cyprini]